MASVRHKRGTRALVDASASASSLRAGEIYLITDQDRLTVGTSATAHKPVAKQSELDDRTAGFRTSSDLLTTGTAQAGFLGSGISSGTNSTNPASGVVTGNHPGCWLLRSSTTANSGYRINTDNDEFRLLGGEIFEAVFRTSASFTNSLVRFGFLDSTSSTDATDGVYFELASTGILTGKTANNATRSTSAAVATLAVSTWYHGRVTINSDATSVAFDLFDDAGSVVGSQTLTSNIPTASGRETGAGLIATNAGTTSSDIIIVDFISVTINRTLQRGAL